MKVLGATAALTASAMLFTIPSFAANTIEITSATTTDGISLSDTAATAPEVSNTELITVNAKISAPAADVSILVADTSVEPSTSSITEADIMYIDQDTSDGSGTCSITFRMPLSAKDSTYAVYVAGTGVESKAVKYLKLADKSEGDTYIVGDVDTKDGVTSADAMYILRYSLGLQTPSSFYVKAGRVYDDPSGDPNRNLNNFDAIYTLRYVLDYENGPGVHVGETRKK